MPGPLSSETIRTERQARFNPLRDLTPERLVTYLDEWRTGRLRNLALLMDVLEERDDTLACVVPKAKAAVARHGWEILTVDTKDDAEAALAERQKDALEYFYNHLRVSNALDEDEQGGVSLLLRQIMDAKAKRYAVHHLEWRPAPGGLYTATLRFVPLWFFENTTGRLRFINTPWGLNGEPMEPREWLVSRGQGVMIACAVAWMFKHIPLKDWLIYCSRHGMPGIEGITDANKGTDEWQQAVDLVNDAAAELAVVHNRQVEIKTIQFGSDGQLPWPPLVERMERKLVALWRGADLSTISSGAGSEGRGANLQGEEADIIEADDQAWASETLNLRLDRLVLDLVFGPDTPALAYFKVLGAQKDTTDLDIKVDEFLLGAGHPISRKQAAERYNRPLPDDDDELLTAPQAAAPAQDGGPGAQGRGRRTEDRAGNVAANEAQAAVAAGLGVPEDWLRPIQDLLAEIERKLRDDSLSDADLQTYLQAAIARVPELFADMDVAGLANLIEGAMGGAVLDTVREDLRAAANSGNSPGAKKGWEIRKRGRAQDQIGKEGTAESLGLPSDAELPVSGDRPSRLDRAQALDQLKAGAQENDPLGRQVVFDQRVYDHMSNVEDERPRFLPLARKTIAQPAEIWQQDETRHFYVAKFRQPTGELGSMVVAVRIGEAMNRVVTFSPKNPRELKSIRKGKLLYAGY